MSKHKDDLPITNWAQCYSCANYNNGCRFNEQPTQVINDGRGFVRKESCEDYVLLRFPPIFPNNSIKDADVLTEPKPLEPSVKHMSMSEEQKRILELFNTSQCSWCKKFYNQPFVCVHGTLHSNCFFFERLSEEDRKIKVADEKWWWRTIERVQQVESSGVLARCRRCGALNPNPEGHTCWHQCGENSITCPRYPGEIILRYNISGDFWKCPNAGHSGKYFFIGETQ